MKDAEDKQRETFLLPETRNEYSISAKQKKIWLVELDLLQELLRVCDKYNIRVVAFAGTLLGAIRHQGFIPWDDDMDVCMDRANFEKLLAIPQEEFRYPFFLQTALSDRKYFFGYARLRNSLTTGLISYYKSKDYNNGIYIDIFVLDGYCEDKKKMNVQMKKINLYSSLLAQYYRDAGVLSGKKKIMYTIIRNTVCRLIPYERMYHLYNNALSMYTKRCDKLTLLTHGDYYIKRYWCYKEDMNNIQMHQFEYISIPIFSEYDRVLKSMYGTYMEFPPVEKRGLWHDGILTFEPDIPYKEYLENETKENAK